MTYTPPGSIDPTGHTDVTDALNGWFATVPDGSTIDLPAEAVYRCEGPIHLVGRHGLHINGHETTIAATTDGADVIPPDDLKHRWPRNRYHLSFVGCTAIHVNRLHIIGPHTEGGPSGDYDRDLEAQHGVNVQGSTDVNLQRIGVRQVWGDFFYVGSTQQQRSSNVRIRFADCDTNGRQGVAVTNASDVDVRDSAFHNIRMSWAVVETNTDADTVTNVTFRNNSTGYCRLPWVVVSGPGSNVGAIHILNNTAHYRTGIPIIHAQAPTGDPRGTLVIRGNRMQGAGSPQPAVRIIRYAHVEYVDNIITRLSADRTMTGFEARACGHVQVADNMFDGATRDYSFIDCGQVDHGRDDA